MQEYFNISLEEYTMEEISALCGPKDAYVDLLCREFQTSFVMRGNELKIRKIDAESEGMVRLVVARLLELVAAQGNISERDVIYLCKLARIGQLERFDVHQTKAIGTALSVPVHGAKRYRVRDRRRRDRKDLSGRRLRGEHAQARRCAEDHPDQTGGRGRGEPGFSAGRPLGEGRPLPASPLRCAL